MGNAEMPGRIPVCHWSTGAKENSRRKSVHHTEHGEESNPSHTQWILDSTPPPQPWRYDATALPKGPPYPRYTVTGPVTWPASWMCLLNTAARHEHLTRLLHTVSKDVCRMTERPCPSGSPSTVPVCCCELSIISRTLNEKASIRKAQLTRRCLPKLPTRRVWAP